MKNLCILVGIAFCIVSLNATGQITPPLHQTLPVKPSLFGQLPQKCSISNAAVEKIFSGESSGTLRIPFGDNFFFEGRVLDKVQKNANAVTVNIRLSNYDNALFTISKVFTGDGSISYRGRIVNINYGDVLILEKENNQLYITKEKQSLFLVE
jgi:hypothetical protein